MTYEELLFHPLNAPVLLYDGANGLFIQAWPRKADVLVPGENDIRSVPIGRLVDQGDYALQENLSLEILLRELINDCSEACGAELDADGLLATYIPLFEELDRPHT